MYDYEDVVVEAYLLGLSHGLNKTAGVELTGNAKKFFDSLKQTASYFGGHRFTKMVKPKFKAYYNELKGAKGMSSFGRYSRAGFKAVRDVFFEDPLAVATPIATSVGLLALTRGVVRKLRGKSEEDDFNVIYLY